MTLPIESRRVRPKFNLIQQQPETPSGRPRPKFDLSSGYIQQSQNKISIESHCGTPVNSPFSSQNQFQLPQPTPLAETLYSGYQYGITQGIQEDPILRVQNLLTNLHYAVNSGNLSSSAETIANINRIQSPSKEVYGKLQEVIFALNNSYTNQLELKSKERQTLLNQIAILPIEIKKEKDSLDQLNSEYHYATSFMAMFKSTRNLNDIQEDIKARESNLSIKTMLLNGLKAQEKDLFNTINALNAKLSSDFYTIANLQQSLTTFQENKLYEAQRTQQLVQLEQKKMDILKQKKESTTKLNEVNIKMRCTFTQIQNLETEISNSTKRKEEIKTTIGFLFWQSKDDIEKDIERMKKELQSKKIENTNLENEANHLVNKINGINIDYLNILGMNYFNTQQHLDANLVLSNFNSLIWTFNKESNTSYAQKDGINYLWNNELATLECPSTLNGQIYYDLTNRNYHIRPFHFQFKSPWVLSKNLHNQISIHSSSIEKSYQKILLNHSHPEYEFVQNWFNQSKPPFLRIKNIYCLYNPNLTNRFVSELSILEQRGQIKPLNESDPQYAKRKKTLEKWENLTKSFYPLEMKTSERTETLFNARILFLWHGTSAKNCDLIAKTGFEFFGKQQGDQGAIASTDIGYFGSGIYFSTSARNASMYSADGKNILLSMVSMTQPYPIVSDKPNPNRRNLCKDMELLQGGQHYQNYTAHFIPVKSLQPSNPNCIEYFPCFNIEEAAWDEIVVFQHSQTLPRFWIELETDV